MGGVRPRPAQLLAMRLATVRHISNSDQCPRLDNDEITDLERCVAYRVRQHVPRIEMLRHRQQCSC
eukprot:174807-Pyramimonas_sp.AAC.1